MAESPSKLENGDRKAGYKSWKKKYRKMRIVFDQKMHDGEELHKQEAKASATVKRLAVENDKLLDLLLDVNNSAQIPLNRRIDVSLKPSVDTNAPILSLDQKYSQQKEQALKRLEQLLNDVPHTTYGVAKSSHAPFVDDLSAPKGETHPAHFLTADDVDDYIYAVDTALDTDEHIPSLAPMAHPGNSSQFNASHPHLKNPTSVTNWLRKHAPKVFLQDGETHGEGEDKEGGGGGKKARAVRGDRGGKAAPSRAKRASTSSRAATSAAAAAAAQGRGDWDASMDDDMDYGTPAAKGGKRKRDDDQAYRLGGSSRPIKKKRKSEGDGTPSVRKAKKSATPVGKEE